MTLQKLTTRVGTELKLSKKNMAQKSIKVFVFAFLCYVGEVQAFHEDLNGRQHINEVYKFSVDKLYDILFTESQFMSDFMEQRRFSGQ